MIIETRAICETTDTTPTAAGGERSCDRPAIVGGWLCEKCIGDTYTSLRAIVDMWPKIQRARFERETQHGERVKHSTTPALPINATVLEWITRATTELHFYTRVILDEHPELAGPKGVAVPAMAGWLASNVDRLAKMEDAALAGSVRKDVHGLTTKARVILDPSLAFRYIPLGVTCLDDGCRAQLHARIRRDELKDAVCDRDWYDADGTTHRHRIAHTVEPHRFRLIARRGVSADVLRTVGA